MKKMIRKTMIRGCSFAMAAMLATGLAFLDPKTALASVTAGKVGGTATLTDVSDRFSTEALRSQYMNSDAVKENVSVRNEERWVIVDFGETCLFDDFEETSYVETFSEYMNTTAAQNLKARIERSHDAFLNRLSANGVSYEYKYSYTALNNGVAIKVKNRDVATVRSMGEVKEVYSSEAYGVPTVAVSNNANVYTTGIYNTKDIEQKGEGMVAAILDTGLDYTHPAFATQPDSPSMTKDSVAEKITGLESYKRGGVQSVNDVYLSAKVPYAYDYADDDTEVYPSYSTHGTHVAGIVAGQDDSKVVNEETGETFIGVAPQAQLVICKVFTDDLESKAVGGANTIDVLASLADCVTLGVDSINMSLGQSSGFSQEGYAQAGVLQDVYDRVEKAGVSLVVAAGNEYSSGFGGTFGTNLTSNPDSGTVGSPSTYDGALSVAAISGQPSHYFSVNQDENKVAFMTESSDANGKAYDFLDLLYEKMGADKNEELTLDYIVIGGVGRASNYNTTSVKNALRGGRTVAVVKRGDISFAEKVQYAKSAGAAACIIYNNVSGNIRMTLGEVNEPIPTVSINMDAGKMLVDSATANKGKITFSHNWSAGPFMTDFSSWGPNPDLKLKPEITAHGGEITSSVPGGYEVQSGTSMAAPNMTGATTLLRQYVKSEYGLEGKELNNRVNQLLMSTATMARNEEGNPYSPRKQGAGLANISDAIKTEAYLTAENNYFGDNSTRDPKPKIELGDDPEKKGVYEFSFKVNSISDKPLTYRPETYVMTESLSTDEKTVAEKAYMLNDSSTIVYRVNGQEVDNVTVPAHGELEISVTVTLEKAARDYLDKTFENGMYLEGFVRLTTSDSESVELGIPYLAFYGDWLKAPLFDYSIYEVEASKADKTVEEEDKIKASGAASRPYGLYNDEKYVITLGSYLYEMPSNYTDILPTEDHAALSCYNMEGKRSIYQLYSLNAGLLRSAKKMEVTISDAVTGEVVYNYVEENVRKSYSAGGSNNGSNIMLKIDPMTWDMSNNRTYVATFKGILDYGDGSREITTERNSYSFRFTVDTESPRVLETRIRFEPYEENRVTKYRIYLDADVYDNHYAMSLFPCYMNENLLDEDGNPMLTLISELPIPIYSQKGGVTTVTYEITDCYEEYLLKDNFYLSVNDYAFNESIFQLHYNEVTEYPEYLTLKTDDKLKTEYDQGSYPVYSLTLEQYENYTVEALSGLPENTAITALNFDVSGDVVCKDNQLFTAKASGSGTVFIRVGKQTLAQINVNIVQGTRAKPIIERVKLSPMLNGGHALVPLSGGEIELKPNMTRQIQANVEPWYTESIYKPVYEYSSSDVKSVVVNENGEITTLAKGYSYITISVKGNNAPPVRVKITVEDELDITNNTLYNYYGGAYCEIPDSKNIMAIDEEAFKDNKLVETVILPISLTSLPENCFSGCDNLKRVVISAECKIINENAFRGLKNLEVIELREAEDKITGENYPGTLTIGRHAFDGCTSLKTITNPTRITTAYDYAFAGCTALEEIDLSGLRTAGKHVFDGCTNLETVTVSQTTRFGSYMFNNCEKLTQAEYYGDSIPDYLFNGCTQLASFTFRSDAVSYLGAYAFADTALTQVTLPNGTYKLGDHAFANCANLNTVTLSAKTDVSFGTSVFKDCGAFAFSGASDTLSVVDGALVRGSTLVLVPFASGEYTITGGITAIGSGAFAGTAVTSVDLSGISEIGEYAFAESAIQTVDLSGLNVVSDGAFYACASLNDVAFSNATTRIGDYAFAQCGKLAKKIVLPAVTEIGNHAFDSTPIIGITGDQIQSVGNYAFYGHNFITDASNTVALPALESVGDFAFARNLNYKGSASNYGKGFTAMSLGPVKQMGQYVFADCLLTSVTFADGTSEIGDFAFVSSKITMDTILNEGVSTANIKIANVTIPASVEKIGDFAFLYASNLVSDKIDLSGVKSIGAGAFWLCGKITDLDLSNAERIGDYAFEQSGLTEARLLNAVQVGAYSFASAPIKVLEIPVMEIIGPFAFAGTSITTVEIPKTLGLTYEDFYDRVDDFGVIFERRGRYFYAFGEGAFASIKTFKTVTVEKGNEHFFTDEKGVLYGIISGTRENGTYMVLQYPAANSQNADNSYSILENTVRIGDGAFYSASGLDEIHIPYTVKQIGSFAFFLCTAKTYVFESVEAPVLEATYSLPVGAGDDFVAATQYYGMYYSNFYNYVVLTVLGNADFKLTIVRPENGSGYSSVIWNGFFSATELSEYAAEEYTLKVEQTIAALPALDDVKAHVSTLASGAEKLAYLTALSKDQISVARKQYNDITSDRQRAMIASSFDKLVALEGYVRETRVSLGDSITLEEKLIAVTPPNRNYYVGQKFDPSGMVLKAIYSDSSEVLLTIDDLTLVSGKVNKAFTLEDEDSEIVYRFGNDKSGYATYTVYISVSEKPAGSEGNGLSAGAIAGICIGVAAVIAGAAAAAFVLLNQRKKQQPKQKAQSEREETEEAAAADADESSADDKNPPSEP